MFQVIWEIKVKFKDREKFEKFYDSKGDWVKFLSKSADYQGTDILESGEGDGIFLVIDEWLTEDSFKTYVTGRKADYDMLEEKAKLVCRSKKRIFISLNPEN
jgi:hypothetical protein